MNKERAQIYKELSQLTGFFAQTILCDDGSKDFTVERALLGIANKIKKLRGNKMFEKLKQEIEEKIAKLDHAVMDEALKILREAIAKIEALEGKTPVDPAAGCYCPTSSEPSAPSETKIE